MPIDTMPEFQAKTDQMPALSTAVLVHHYRELKARTDSLAAKMNELREAIQQRVEVEPYQDDIGYAKMLSRDASTTYSAKDVIRLQDVWLNSDVPNVRTCGEHLQSLGKTKPSTTYLQITGRKE